MAEYRDKPRRCPQCTELMVVPAQTREATAAFDVCPSCGGVWVDWLDGDLGSVERSLGKLPRAAGREQTTETPECPDCQRPLHADEFGGAKAPIQRCGDCAGTFVPRSSLELLDASPPPAGEAAQDPWITRVMDGLWRMVSGR